MKNRYKTKFDTPVKKTQQSAGVNFVLDNSCMKINTIFFARLVYVL